MSEEIITETQAPDIAALVEFIAKSLVDEPSEVKVAVKADEAGEETTIELSVAKDDMGKVIGQTGAYRKSNPHRCSRRFGKKRKEIQS